MLLIFTFTSKQNYNFKSDYPDHLLFIRERVSRGEKAYGREKEFSGGQALRGVDVLRDYFSKLILQNSKSYVTFAPRIQEQISGLFRRSLFKNIFEAYLSILSNGEIAQLVRAHDS